MENALAPSTRSSYSTAWSSFTNFCEQNQISYTSYNLQLLLAFIAHLRLSLRLAPSSIKMLPAGIQYQFRLQSIPSPLLSSVPEIRLTLRGMEKSLPPSSPLRQPISTDLLLHLITALRQGCFNPFDDIIMETLCLIAFFGFLRCSEFSTPSTSSFPALGLKRSDLSQIPGNHFILHIRSSKTDQLSQEIRLTLRGMEKSLPPSSPSRQPISTDLLLHLIIALRQGCFNPFDDIVMETLCLIAFFGFLRCSEFSTPSTSSFPALGLKRSDLSQIPGNHFILHIRSSKTDQLSQDTLPAGFRVFRWIPSSSTTPDL
ncbi:UNVERIFIED_CONTAM: hypothetical protein FKN15_048037 [Acipenser sinensis]